MARNIYPISSSLFNTIKHYARFPQHSKSLKEMVEFGKLSRGGAGEGPLSNSSPAACIPVRPALPNRSEPEPRHPDEGGAVPAPGAACPARPPRAGAGCAAGRPVGDALGAASQGLVRALLRGAHKLADAKGDGEPSVAPRPRAHWRLHPRRRQLAESARGRQPVLCGRHRKDQTATRPGHYADRYPLR